MANNLHVATEWDYAYKHIDPRVKSNGFMSSNRTVIYAGPYNADSQGEQPPLVPIGLIQTVGHNEARQMAKIFEIGSDLPYHVMGTSSGTITLARVLINGPDLVNAILGKEAKNTGAWISSLSEIDTPVNLCFVCFPNGANKEALADKTSQFSRVFVECYFPARSESFGANQMLLMENLQLSYTRIAGGQNDALQFTTGEIQV